MILRSTLFRRTLTIATSLLSCCGCAHSRKPDGNPTGRAAPHLVFLLSEDPSNYEAHTTVPVFAQAIQREHGFRCTVIRGEGEPNAFRFPGLQIVRKADLLVIFFRRRALPSNQMELIRAHLKAGKPLVGIRTANHAFSVNGDVPEGYEKWWAFVPEVLGCENRGYGKAGDGTDVVVSPEAVNHPILSEVEPRAWHSGGSLYLVKPLTDPQATVLLTGSAKDKTEPVAWTRMHGSSRIFYTSLGDASDFDLPQFRRLLINGIEWALRQPAYPAHTWAPPVGPAGPFYSSILSKEEHNL